MLVQNKYKFLFLPVRGTFNESFKEKRFLRDLDHVYAFLIGSFPGINDIYDIVFTDQRFYDPRLDLVGRLVCVNKYYDEDYLKKYCIPQCIGYLYDYS